MKTGFITLLMVSLLFISACVKTEETRGYVAEFSHFDKIKTGETTKEEALKIMGSPSSKSTFGKEQWYYIGNKMERIAFFDPEIVKQDVLYLTFDENGIVKEAGKKGTEDARKIAISDDKTRTEGNKIGVVEQLLGNLGRFNPKE